MNPRLKNGYPRCFGLVVEYCVFYNYPEVLEHWLEQGANVEDKGRPILQYTEIDERLEETRGILRNIGADPT